MVRIQEQFEQVQAVKKSINTASEAVKNQALLAMADHLLAASEKILAANALDMATAKGKISDVMLDRLYLDAGRIEAMARGIREVVALPDPIGEVLETSQLENGLVITKKRVAMGVSFFFPHYFVVSCNFCFFSCYTSYYSFIKI